MPVNVVLECVGFPFDFHEFPSLPQVTLALTKLVLHTTGLSTDVFKVFEKIGGNMLAGQSPGLTGIQ